MLIRSSVTALIFLCWMVLFPGTLTVALSAEVTGDSGWYQLETLHTIIHYQNTEDLKRFDRKIAFHTGKWGVLGAIFGSNSEAHQDKIRKKVDGIFKKVQQLLGMRKRMEKVHIYICRNKKQLHDNYYKIYRKPCRYRAWYAHELNTVYLNIKDLDEGMLSHELAHSIIDHYLLVRPPRASAEILATYVDRHLFD